VTRLFTRRSRGVESLRSRGLYQVLHAYVQADDQRDVVALTTMVGDLLGPRRRRAAHRVQLCAHLEERGTAAGTRK